MKLIEIAKLTVVEQKSNSRGYFGPGMYRVPKWTNLQLMLIYTIPLENQMQITNDMRRTRK